MTGLIYQDTTQKDYQAKLEHLNDAPLTELSLELDPKIANEWMKNYM